MRLTSALQPLPPLPRRSPLAHKDLIAHGSAHLRGQRVEPNTRKDKEVADQWLHGTQDFGPRDRNIAQAYRASSSRAGTRGRGGGGGGGGGRVNEREREMK